MNTTTTAVNAHFTSIAIAVECHLVRDIANLVMGYAQPLSVSTCLVQADGRDIIATRQQDNSLVIEVAATVRDEAKDIIVKDFDWRCWERDRLSIDPTDHECYGKQRQVTVAINRYPDDAAALNSTMSFGSGRFFRVAFWIGDYDQFHRENRFDCNWATFVGDFHMQALVDPMAWLATNGTFDSLKRKTTDGPPDLRQRDLQFRVAADHRLSTYCRGLLVVVQNSVSRAELQFVLQRHDGGVVCSRRLAEREFEPPSPLVYDLFILSCMYELKLANPRSKQPIRPKRFSELDIFVFGFVLGNKGPFRGRICPENEGKTLDSFANFFGREVEHAWRMAGSKRECVEFLF